jgi:hypothetical protein
VKKDRAESLTKTVIYDEKVRRACADFVIAIVRALLGERRSDAPPDN